MIVEFLACGDLLDLLRRSRETDNKKDVPCTFLSEQDFINFSYDVACGMAHIAAANVSFRNRSFVRLVLERRCCSYCV